jgi:hypothetical protein
MDPFYAVLLWIIYNIEPNKVILSLKRSGFDHISSLFFFFSFFFWYILWWSDYVVSNGIMVSELERIWTEEIMVWSW